MLNQNRKLDLDLFLEIFYGIIKKEQISIFCRGRFFFWLDFQFKKNQKKVFICAEWWNWILSLTRKLKNDILKKVIELFWNREFFRTKKKGDMQNADKCGKGKTRIEQFCMSWKNNQRKSYFKGVLLLVAVGLVWNSFFVVGLWNGGIHFEEL